MKHELLDALIEDLKDIYWRIVRFTKTIPMPEHHIRWPFFFNNNNTCFGYHC